MNGLLLPRKRLHSRLGYFLAPSMNDEPRKRTETAFRAPRPSLMVRLGRCRLPAQDLFYISRGCLAPEPRKATILPHETQRALAIVILRHAPIIGYVNLRGYFSHSDLTVFVDVEATVLRILDRTLPEYNVVGIPANCLRI